MRFITNGVIILSILLLSACGGGAAVSREELKDLKPYVNTGLYAEQLVPCAQANLAWSSCRINTLPPLAMEKPEPTLDDVMERVAVSHPWMGLRFQQLLTRLPEDMYYLFGGVTAIVIDDDIRPSYYWNITGAIYLDPASLWLTLEEKDTISREPDFRSGNESEMRFRKADRQTIDGHAAYRHFGLDSTEPRTLDDIVLPMAKLLFHELSHANDYFPRQAYATVDRNKRIYAVTEGLYEQYASTKLKQDLPLTASMVFQAADIFYRGHTPSEEQTFWTAEQIGNAFGQDGASDMYGYSSQYEDLAMLMQDAMMNIHFNVVREQAFIEAPDQKYPECGNRIVSWGQLNRIGDPWVKERLKHVLSHILPDRDYVQRIDELIDPIHIPPGTDWCDYVNNGL